MTYGVGRPPYGRGRTVCRWEGEGGAPRRRERETETRGNKNDRQRLVHIAHDVLAQKRMTNEGLFFILHRIASAKSLRRKNIINSDRV